MNAKSFIRHPDHPSRHPEGTQSEAKRTRRIQAIMLGIACLGVAIFLGCGEQGPSTKVVEKLTTTPDTNKKDTKTKLPTKDEKTSNGVGEDDQKTGEQDIPIAGWYRPYSSDIPSLPNAILEEANFLKAEFQLMGKETIPLETFSDKSTSADLAYFPVFFISKHAFKARVFFTRKESANDNIKPCDYAVTEGNQHKSFFIPLMSSGPNDPDTFGLNSPAFESATAELYQADKKSLYQFRHRFIAETKCPATHHFYNLYDLPLGPEITVQKDTKGADQIILSAKIYGPAYKTHWESRYWGVVSYPAGKVLTDSYFYPITVTLKRIKNFENICIDNFNNELKLFESIDLCQRKHRSSSKPAL